MASAPPTMSTLPQVDLVVPVLNEAHVLERSVLAIRSFLGGNFPYPWRIVVAENGSADGTAEVARELAERFDDVSVVELGRRGRGRALRVAWTSSNADIVAYTDVDVSTELEALEKVCRAIWEEGYDVAVGSRLSPGSQVERGLKREIISRAYNLFLRSVLRTRFADAQCGFKAVSRRVVDEIVPEVRDQGWFFDTELLVLAEKRGYRIQDVPVRWTDDDDSRVRILPTAWEDVKGVMRLRRYLWSHAFREYVPAGREESTA